jgi:hypothetical protein
VCVCVCVRVCVCVCVFVPLEAEFLARLEVRAVTQFLSQGVVIGTCTYAYARTKGRKAVYIYTEFFFILRKKS